MIRRLTLLALLAVAGVAVAIGTARAQAGAPDAAPRISMADFKRLVASKNVIVVDTRNPESYRMGRIPGAILLPLEGQLTWPESYEQTVAMLKASGKPIVTYCA